jgi:hypothetical protein
MLLDKNGYPKLKGGDKETGHLGFGVAVPTESGN